MLQANTTTYPSGSALNVLDAPSSRHRPTDEHVAVRRERQSELAIDDALAGSFPASDPPAWNPEWHGPFQSTRHEIAPTTADRAWRGTRLLLALQVRSTRRAPSRLSGGAPGPHLTCGRSRYCPAVTVRHSRW